MLGQTVIVGACWRGTLMAGCENYMRIISNWIKGYSTNLQKCRGFFFLPPILRSGLGSTIKCLEFSFMNRQHDHGKKGNSANWIFYPGSYTQNTASIYNHHCLFYRLMSSADCSLQGFNSERQWRCGSCFSVTHGPLILLAGVSHAMW